MKHTFMVWKLLHSPRDKRILQLAWWTALRIWFLNCRELHWPTNRPKLLWIHLFLASVEHHCLSKLPKWQKTQILTIIYSFHFHFRIGLELRESTTELQMIRISYETCETTYSRDDSNILFSLNDWIQCKRDERNFIVVSIKLDSSDLIEWCDNFITK